MSKSVYVKRLLAKGEVYVHFDPRVKGVIVPSRFSRLPHVEFVFGYGMQIPIVDLEVTIHAISGTLRIDGAESFCRVPWRAVYALFGQADGDAMVWTHDVPPEMAGRFKAGTGVPVSVSKNTINTTTKKKRRFPPYLRLVK